MMESNGWDALVITASDPHSSEYPGLRWKQVQWLTGFAGECGDLVITKDHAGLWTDTRYFIQANKVLPGTGYELHKTRVPEQVLIPEWLAKHAFADKEGQVVVALDGMTQTLSAVSDIRSAFEEAGRSEGTGAMTYSLVNAPDLLDELWEDRPAYPQSPIITLSAELAGESRQERIAWLRSEMEAKKCSAILLTALDEIVWMLNVRGSDVNYNPVIYSYLLVTQDKVQWYVVKNSHVAPDGETAASFDELRKDAVDVLPYSDVEMGIAALEGKRLWADPGTSRW